MYIAFVPELLICAHENSVYCQKQFQISVPIVKISNVS